MKQKRLAKEYNFYVGLILTGIMVGLILLGFFYTSFDPDAMRGSEKLSAPSLLHLMGTDNFGRDILSRVLVGAGNTLVIAVGTILIGGVIGIIAGSVTGYFGGWLDEILMRVNDALASFPSVLLALVFISVLGPGKYKVMMALGIIFIPSFARVLSSLTIGFNNAVIAEAGMSYLGIGVQPPDASLGRMLSEAQSYLAGGPWCAIFPGIFIVLLVLGVSMLGEGILDRFGGGR